MKAFRGFAALPPKEKRIALGLVLRLIGAELRMTLLPYRFTRKLVFRRMPKPSEGTPEELRILRCHIVLLKAICEHLPWKVTCLRKAVALRDSLRAAGVYSAIRLGVNRGGNEINAHAWLECCGYELLKNGAYQELMQAK